MNQNKVVTYTGMNDYIFKEIFQRKKFLVAYLHILGIDAMICTQCQGLLVI